MSFLFFSFVLRRLSYIDTALSFYERHRRAESNKNKIQRTPRARIPFPIYILPPQWPMADQATTVVCDFKQIL